ncbi:MAG: dTDP-4-dehydrorhamnose reductase [candidate division WOR-3 bacterium]
MSYPKSILITGAEGQLGSELVEILSKNYRTFGADLKDFDITDFKTTENCIKKVKPQIIIHTAAYTDVDGCEKEKEKAFKVNSLGTRNLSIVARKINAKFFYISTDYVFSGEKEEPYYEYDQPSPINIYGKTKLLGEIFVKEQLNNFFILRIAWLYGKNGINFIKKIIQLAKTNEEIKVVNDQFGSPTWTVSVINQIEKLLSTELYGTYHCSSEGKCSWFEFALEILKELGYKIEKKDKESIILKMENKELKSKFKEIIKLKGIKSEEFKSLAKRPKNSVLENYLLKLQNLNIMPHWKEDLIKFIKQQTISFRKNDV